MTGPNVTACTDRFRSTKDHAGVDIRGTRLGIDCHLDVDEWQRLRADIKAGKYDDLHPDGAPRSVVASRTPITITDLMVEAFGEAWWEANDHVPGDRHEMGYRRRAGLAGALRAAGFEVGNA